MRIEWAWNSRAATGVEPSLSPPFFRDCVGGGPLRPFPLPPNAAHSRAGLRAGTGAGRIAPAHHPDPRR